MRKAQLEKRIRSAIGNVQGSIRQGTDRENLFSRGLSMEGFEGGYYRALCDVLVLIGGGEPYNDRGYWRTGK